MRSLAHFVVAVVCFGPLVVDLQWGTADAEIKVFSAENPERLKVLPLKPGGQHTDMRTSPPARNFFLSNSHTTSGPISLLSFFFFFQTFPCFCFFFLSLGVANVNQLLLIRLQSCFGAC